VGVLEICILVVCFLLGNSPASELIQTSGNYLEENIQHTEHSESLKSRMYTCIYCVLYRLFCFFFVLFHLCIFILICFACTKGVLPLSDNSTAVSSSSSSSSSSSNNNKPSHLSHLQYQV
jgi:hypothetical protein